MATPVEIASGYVSVYASISSSDVKRAVTEALAGITGNFNVKADTTSAANALSGLAGSAGSIGKALTAVGVGVGVLGEKFTSWAMESIADMETVSIAMTNMTGSAELAQETISQIGQLAVVSPYTFSTLEQAGQRLLALGFSAEQVTPTLTAVGDAIAATGGDQGNYTAVIKDLGQMQSLGKVTSRVMTGLAMNSIPAWQMLADYLGVSVSQARDEVMQGAVDADTGITAILSGMEGRYGGMMKVASETVTGILSNMLDAVQVNIMELSTNDGYAALRTSLSTMVTPLMNFFTALQPTFSNLMASAASGITTITGLMTRMTNAINANPAGLTTVLHIVGSLVMLGPGLILFSKYLNGASAALKGMGTVAGVVQGVATSGVSKISAVLSDSRKYVDTEKISSGLKGVSQTFGNFFQTLSSEAKFQGKLLNGNISSMFKGLKAKIPPISIPAVNLGPLSGIASKIQSIASHSPAVAALSDAFKNLGEQMPSASSIFISSVGKMLGVFGGFSNVSVIISAVLVAIAAFGAVSAGVFVRVGGNLNNLANKFSTDLGSITGVVTNAMASFTAMLPRVSQQLITAIPTILTAVNGLVSGVVNQLMAMLPQLIPVVTQIATGLGTLIIQNAPLILQAAIQLFAGFITAMAQTISNLIPQLPGFINQIGQVLQQNAPALGAAAIQLFMALVQAFVTILPIIVNDLPILINDLTQFLIANGPAIGSAALQLFMAIVQALPGILGALATGILQLIAAAAGWIIGGVPSVLSAGGQLFMTLVDSVGNVLGSLLGALGGLIGNAAGAISGGVGQMISAAGDFFGGLLKGANDKAGELLDWVGGLPGRILDALGDLGSLLWDAGSKIINGFLDGLKSAWGGVTDFIGGIADWIAQHKGPISYDAKLLIPHGNAIMQGLGVGLTAGFSSYVIGTVNGMSSQIADQFKAKSMKLQGLLSSTSVSAQYLADSPASSPTTTYNSNEYNVYAGNKDEYVLASVLARATNL